MRGKKLIDREYSTGWLSEARPLTRRGGLDGQKKTRGQRVSSGICCKYHKVGDLHIMRACNPCYESKSILKNLILVDDYSSYDPVSECCIKLLTDHCFLFYNIHYFHRCETD